MIYFCIPAYNEEKTIGVLLWKLRQVMANFPRDYQLLVMDDASTDKTSEALRPYQRVLPLTVLRNEQRRGYAASLEMLIREAARRSEYPKRDAIVTLQADFTEDPEQVVILLKRIEAGDDIVATRPVLPEDAPWQFRWSRKLALRAIRRRGWPEDVDPLSGLRAYRVQVIRKAIEGANGRRLLTWSGWLANAELLAAAQPHSRRTEAVESTFRPERHRRPSRLHPWKLVWQAVGFGRGRPSPESAAPLEALPPAGEPPRRGKEELQAFVESRGITRERPARPTNGRGRDRARERGDRDREQGRTRREGDRRVAGEGRRQPGAAAGRSGERRQRTNGADRRAGAPRVRQERNGDRPEAAPTAEPDVLAAQEALAALEQSGLIPAPESGEAGMAGGLLAAPEGEAPKRRRRRRGRGRSRRAPQTAENETTSAPGDTSVEQLELVAAGPAGAAEPEAAEGEEGSSEAARRTGRRRRRGGRRGRGRARAAMDSTQEGGNAAAGPDSGDSGPAEGGPNHEVPE